MKRIILVLILLVGTALSSACSITGKNTLQAERDFSTVGSSTYYPVTISNYNSQKEKTEFIFKKVPERVFALHQNSIETLLALGLEDHIIGCAGDIPPVFKSDAYPYREGFKKANYLGNENPPLEKLLVMNPDFILGWYSTFAEKKLGTTDFWKERGVNTYIAESSNDVLPKKTVEVEYKYILDIGKIFNRQEKAAAIVKEMEDEIQNVVRLAAGKKKSKTMIIELMHNTITVYGKDQLAGDMVTRLGAELMDCGSHINDEELIGLNPEVVFIAYMGEDGQKDVEQFLQTESLASLSCVKNKRVYAIPLTYMYASATKTLDGIRVFARGLYPELY